MYRPVEWIIRYARLLKFVRTLHAAFTRKVIGSLNSHLLLISTTIHELDETSHLKTPRYRSAPFKGKSPSFLDSRCTLQIFHLRVLMHLNCHCAILPDPTIRLPDSYCHSYLCITISAHSLLCSMTGISSSWVREIASDVAWNFLSSTRCAQHWFDGAIPDKLFSWPSHGGHSKLLIPTD
jgi:hypothetical protein